MIESSFESYESANEYPGILKLLIQRVINLIYQFLFLPESFGITSGCDKI